MRSVHEVSYSEECRGRTARTSWPPSWVRASRDHRRDRLRPLRVDGCPASCCRSRWGSAADDRDSRSPRSPRPRRNGRIHCVALGACGFEQIRSGPDRVVASCAGDSRSTSSTLALPGRVPPPRYPRVVLGVSRPGAGGRSRGLPRDHAGAFGFRGRSSPPRRRRWAQAQLRVAGRDRRPGGDARDVDRARGFGLLVTYPRLRARRRPQSSRRRARRSPRPGRVPTMAWNARNGVTATAMAGRARRRLEQAAAAAVPPRSARARRREERLRTASEHVAEPGAVTAHPHDAEARVA